MTKIAAARRAADTAFEAYRTFLGTDPKAIDAMIDAIVGARMEEDFTAAVRAFDRILISGAYAVPLFHVSDDWVGHWSRVVPPKVNSLYGVEFDTWWSADAAVN